MFRRIAIAAAALAAALLVAPRQAAAQTATATLTVTARVVPVCTIANQALAFGDYDTNTATDNDAPVVNITVQCTRGSQFTLSLGNGGAYTTVRRMTDGGGNYLEYQLFSDAGHTTEWTNPSATQTASLPGAGLNPYTFPVYGRIRAGQDVPTGNYADAVTMTVNF